MTLEQGERRSSRRVPVALPVEFSVRGSSHRGLIALVNRRGALLLTRTACPPGEILDIRLLQTGAVSKFRVVWSGPDDSHSDYTHRAGIASFGLAHLFWGPAADNPADATRPPDPSDSD